MVILYRQDPISLLNLLRPACKSAKNQSEILFFSYTGSPPYVLDGIDLEIHDGEYVSVVGENGSGKRTLMRLLLKFIKPSSGSIVSQAKRIGYVPQKNDFSNSDFPITVYEALDSYRRLLKIKGKDTIAENLEQVEMSDFKDALMGNPDLLILDEPSTGVDVTRQKEIYVFLKKINQEPGDIWLLQGLRPDMIIIMKVA